MFTASLRYITATFQSVAMNLIPVVVVFVLAVACRRERFHFWDARGQAKLWGLLASASGATVVVVSSAREEDGSAGDGGLFVGTLMVGVAVLAAATASLFAWMKRRVIQQ